MSVSQADLDNLDRMIASGVLSTMYDGKRIEYRSMAELRTARSVVANLIAAASGLTAPDGTSGLNLTPAFSRGI